MKVSRRQLLIGALGTAGLLALGGAGLGLRGTVYREPQLPLQALSPRQFSVLAAIADRICPGDASKALPGATEVQVAEKIDALLASADPALVGELGPLLLLIENALPGLLLDGRPTPFTAASPAVQDATLEAWRSSGLVVRRKAFKALCNLCNASYWSDPRTYAGSGYPGPPNYA